MNQHIRTIAILGAGAVGSYLVMGLSDKYKENLWVIADGERKDRLAKNGLNINDKVYSLHIKTPAEAHGVDLLFVCTKYTQLRDSLPDIETITDKHTMVVSLLNGVDSEELIGQRIGMEHMIYSLIRIASHRIGNSIHFSLPKGYNGIYIGIPNQPASQDPRLAAISEIFADTPVTLHLSDDILLDMWDKFGLNVSRNLPQAILGVGIGVYDDSIYADAIMRRMRHEVVLVANAKGIPLTDEFKAAKWLPSQRYSTLQDLDAHRHTEIDMFSGALIRMGKEVGVECPYNEMTYNLIKALEEKNDGKFDY